jgi:hypothetical protein
VHPQLFCGSCVILWDQTTTYGGFPFSGQAVESQRFGANNTMFNARGADDFTTGSAAWTVQELFVEGSYFNTPAGGPTPLFLRVRFFFDSGNGPGAPVPGGTGACVFVEAPPGTYDSVLATDCTGPLSGNIVLNPATHYWISVVLRMNFGSGGQWGWNLTTTQTGAPAYWKNPGGGFSTGCNAWTILSTCIPGSAPDFQFLLAGN